MAIWVHGFYFEIRKISHFQLLKYVLLSNRENVLLTNKSCSYHTKIDLCSKIETSLISNTKNMLISNTNVTYFYKKSTHHK